MASCICCDQAMYRTFNVWSEHIGLFLLIGLPLFFGYLKLRVLLANEPFSLAWSFAELEPPQPVVNVSAAVYVCVAWQQ